MDTLLKCEPIDYIRENVSLKLFFCFQTAKRHNQSCFSVFGLSELRMKKRKENTSKERC